MAEPVDSPDDKALWQRWRRLAPAAAGEPPDALTLAAYVEGRLGPAEIEAVEDWLSADPDLATDLAIARQATFGSLHEAADGVIARASALVRPESAQIVMMRPTVRLSRWRGMARWSAMAASILIVSAIGFALGNDAYMSLAGTQPAAFGQELLDPSSGLFSGFEEDANI